MLLVEADEAGRRALFLLLRRAGYEVRAAEGLDEARETLSAESFDVVVVDLDLPGGEWRRLVAMARDTAEPETPRVLGISARGDGSWVPDAGVHLDAWLSKPLDLRALYGLLGPGSAPR